MTDITLPDFKRKHGLGYKHIQKLCNCTLDEARALSQGQAPVPDDIARMVVTIDAIVSEAKANSGIFTDIDAQHAIHEIEKRDKRIAELEGKIAQAINILKPTAEPVIVPIHPELKKILDNELRPGRLMITDRDL